MSYILDDGPDDGTTRRTFVDRYNAIVDNWAPADSFVDFGGYNGRLARNLAAEFDIHGTVIDSYPGLTGGLLVETVNKDVTPRELGKIIRDLPSPTTVIALSVLHHLPDWEKYIGAISRNAKTAFVETANPDEVLPEAVAHGDSAKIIRAVEKLGGVPVGESAGWDSRFMRTTWRIDF